MEKENKNYLNIGTVFGVLAFFSGLYLLYNGETVMGISGGITGLFVAYISSVGAEKKTP